MKKALTNAEWEERASEKTNLSIRKLKIS